eukprot:60397-Hanusia_phi.AAC.1
MATCTLRRQTGFDSVETWKDPPAKRIVVIGLLLTLVRCPHRLGSGGWWQGRHALRREDRREWISS